MRSLNLLEEFSAARAHVTRATENGAHLGSGVVGGVQKDYLFIHPPSSVSFTLPKNALRFSASVAIHPDVWDKENVGSVEFRVLSDGRPVFRFTVSRPEHDGQWEDIAVEIPANDTDDRRLTLTTATVDDGGFQWAIWGDPQVVLFPSDGVDGRDVQPLDRRPAGWNPAGWNPAGWNSAPESESPYPLLLPEGTRVVFLAGTEDSGAARLMALLDAHPEVICKGGMSPLEILDADRPGSLPAPTLESVASDASMLRAWYMADNSAWNVPFRGEGRHAHSDQDVSRDFVRFFFEWTLERFCRTTSQPLPRAFVDSSPVHTPLIMRKIQHYFGVYEPHMIHLVRDPRDVLVSRWLRHRWQQLKGDDRGAAPFRDEKDKLHAESLLADPEGLIDAGGAFFNDRAVCGDFFKEWVDVNESMAEEGPLICGSKYCRVRFEDLKEDLPSVLAGVFESLNVDSSEEVIADVIERCDVGTEGGPAPDGFREDRDGLWKSLFAEEDLKRFADRVGPVSERFGYA